MGFCDEFDIALALNTIQSGSYVGDRSTPRACVDAPPHNMRGGFFPGGGRSPGDARRGACRLVGSPSAPARVWHRVRSVLTACSRVGMIGVNRQTEA